MIKIFENYFNLIMLLFGFVGILFSFYFTPILFPLVFGLVTFVSIFIFLDMLEVKK